MPELIRFELKKIATRRTTLVTCAVTFAMLCGIMALNIMQTYSAEPGSGAQHAGLKAIAYDRSVAEARAGAITPERAAADVNAYQELVFSKASPDELTGLSGQAAYELMRERCTDEELDVLYDPYFQKLVSPWRTSGTEPYQAAALMAQSGVDPASFYDRIAENRQAALDAALEDASTADLHYTPAEYELWTSKASQVSTPFEYGYAGAWEDVVNCAAFLVFAMVAVCVALAPVFSAEYAERTDAVLLSARWGRGKLAAAKVISSLLFATAFFALCAAVVAGVPIACFGAHGASLPVQLVNLTIPYDLTMGEAAALAVGLAYAFTLGVAGLTLALSSRLRSQLAVFAVVMALLFGTSMVGTGASELLVRALSLFPMRALGFTLFNGGISYGLGPAAVDLIGMATILWTGLALVCAPFAARSFKRHQVM